MNVQLLYDAGKTVTKLLEPGSAGILTAQTTATKIYC